MFSVDLEELDRIVGALTRFETFVEDQLDRLDKRIAQMHEVWTGAAADAQRSAHDEWMAASADMRSGLAQIRSAGRTAHGNYSAAVTANKTMWNWVS